MTSISLDHLFLPYKDLYGLGVSKIIPWLEPFWAGTAPVKGPGTTAKSINDIVRLARGLPAENNITPKAKSVVDAAVQKLSAVFNAANLTWNPQLEFTFNAQNFNQANPISIPIRVNLGIEAVNKFTLVQIIYTRQIHTAAGIKEITQKYLSLLASYAILKSTGHVLSSTINSIGFIVPLQGQAYLYELATWNHLPWLNEVIYLINQMFNTSTINGLYQWAISVPTIGRDLGTPYGYENEQRILRSMSELTPQSTFQIMLPLNKTGLQMNNAFITQFKQLLTVKQLQFYVHSPIRMGELLGYYGVRQVSGAGMSPEQAKYQLRQLMYYTHQLGGKGVVIHVPKGGDQQIIAFTKNVAGVIERLLGRRPRDREFLLPDTETKIYLETPAGQGTETLTHQQEFIDIFSHEQWRDPAIQELIGIGADTCHIFALGYDPLEYIKALQTQLPHKALMIHFNDNRADDRFRSVRGGRLDRHAWPGTGYLGGKRCSALREHIYQYNLPAIIEVGIDFQREELEVEG